MTTENNNSVSGFVEPDARLDAPETFGDWLADRLRAGQLPEQYQKLILDCFAPFLGCLLTKKDPSVAAFFLALSMRLDSHDIAQFGQAGESAQWIEAVFQFLYREQKISSFPPMPDEIVRKIRLTLENLVAKLPIDWPGLFKV